MNPGVPAAIGLGSSLGPRVAWLRFACARLDATAGVRVVRASRPVRTPPMAGSAARGWFLNAVVRVHTALPAHALLEVCIDIERRAGRRAGLRWADRTLDVDLLLVGSEVVDEPGLCLPHPSIRQRPFVLEPLLEVWPDALGAPSHGEAAPASAPVPVRATLWRRLGVDRTPG